MKKKVCEICTHLFDPIVIEEICDACFEKDQDDRKNISVKLANPKLLKENKHIKSMLKEIRAQIRKLDQWSDDNRIGASGFLFPLDRIEEVLNEFETSEDYDEPFRIYPHKRR